MYDDRPVRTIEFHPVDVTEDNIYEYGNLFTDFNSEKVRLEKWPPHPKGFRTVHDGVGGGETEGSFAERWIDKKLQSTNSGVADGCYDSFAVAVKGGVIVQREINYHGCGSQAFICYTHDIYLFAASNPADDIGFPDNVELEKFKCFRIPKGTGVHINSYVWHSPPFIHPNDPYEALIFTKQARVHSKIYYDPITESKKIAKINLE